MKKILYNADFISLEDTSEDIKAIFIDNGKIEKIGKEKEILSLRDSKTEIMDLSGKTVMPSFIDAHSHFFAVANDISQVNLNNCRTSSEKLNAFWHHMYEKNKKTIKFMQNML